jgi:hypothetical protein
LSSRAEHGTRFAAALNGRHQRPHQLNDCNDLIENQLSEGNVHAPPRAPTRSFRDTGE